MCIEIGTEIKWMGTSLLSFPSDLGVNSDSASYTYELPTNQLSCC